MPVAEALRPIEVESPIRHIEFVRPIEEGEILHGQHERNIRTSLKLVLSSQHESGHFPAASVAAADSDAHMDSCAWLRDEAEIIKAINNGVLQLGMVDVASNVKQASLKWANRVLGEWASPIWQEGFKQKTIKDQQDMHLRLEDPAKAPPIHVRVDGSECRWPTQDQPDSYGNAFLALSMVINNGFFELNPDQQTTLETAIKFIVDGNIAKREFVSAWEWTRIHSPNSLSTRAITAQGLDAIKPFASTDLQNRIGHVVDRLMADIKSEYPRDFTVQTGHNGEADLALLSALASGALDSEAVSPYLVRAKLEGLLGDQNTPGFKRFSGDYYHKENGREAVWPLGDLLLATVLFKRSLRNTGAPAELLVKLADKSLEKVNKIVEMYGIIPELFEWGDDGKWHLPTGKHRNFNGSPTAVSDLLWAHSARIQASTYAIAAHDALKT